VCTNATGVRWLLMAALLLCVSALQAQAQQPVPEISVEAELVRLDVVATDGKGQPVSGLAQGDFAVFEDGKVQEVAQFEAFERVRLDGREAGPAPRSRSETILPTRARPRRHVVLAIDDLHISLGDLVQVREALLGFVDRELGPDDAAAVVATSGALGVTQQFTRDVELVRGAIARVSPKPLQTWPGFPHITRYQAELILRGDIEALDLAVEEVKREMPRHPRPEEVARQKARGVFKESTEYAHATLATLDSMMRGLAEVPGRKVVVLVSDGFLLGLGVSGGLDQELRRMVDAATRAGIVVYSLDTRGLLATTESERPESLLPRSTTHPGLRERLGRQAEHAERDGLNAVAEDTGGFLVYGVNDLGAGLSRIARDTETYYLLAYAPTNTKHDGKFRKIEVRLPGHPELKVRTRTGYFAPDDRQARKDREEPEQGGAARELQAALLSLYPRSGIPVRLAADFISQGDAGEQLLLSAHVDLGAARFRQEGERQQARLVLVGTVYDAAGQPAVNLEPEAIDLAFSDAQLQHARREGLKYVKVLDLAPGEYVARLAVRDDASGQLGSASARITLPDLSDGRLRMAGPVLMHVVDEGSETALRQVQAYPRYGRDEGLYYQLQVLNPTTDDSGVTGLTIQAHVLQDNEVVGSSAEERLETRPEGSLPPDFTGRLSLFDLEPGEYQLQVVVADQLAGTRVERAVGFTVEP
jgi:VWFA-related protein